MARAHKGWALDQVTLHNEVTKFAREEVKVPPAVIDYTVLINTLVFCFAFHFRKVFTCTDCI